MNKIGKVILVGAGPGDPGLLTLKGEEALRGAHAVVYDWLVNPELLHLAPQAEKIFVGKKGGIYHSIEQKEIHRLLLRLVRRGKSVVRLKGGDPFIFARGGEEAGFLAQHRIPFEVVPGVSAGTGVPVYAGIPLTDRRFASQVLFVTGHEDPKKGSSAVEWQKLGSFGGTLVSFMGVKNLPSIVRRLLAGGKSPETPCAVIEWGTLPHQRVVIGTLSNIVKKTRKAKIESPSLTLIGEVVRLRKKLNWFDKRPLQGKTILVTRARDQASELVRRLKEKGARVLEFPTIEIFPPSNPARIRRETRRLWQYDWVLFTSANGVRFFFDEIQQLGNDARIFFGVRVGAIGEKTAQALRDRGLRPDLVPKEFTSHALFRSLKKADEIQGKKFLLARADIAPPDLKESLEKEGAEVVVELEAYRTKGRVPSKGDSPLQRGQSPKKGTVPRRGDSPLQALAQGRIDYVTFTSSSTVQNFFDSIPARLRKRIPTRFVTIGPVTSRTLRSYGFHPAKEARVHTIEGLVKTLCNGQ